MLKYLADEKTITVFVNGELRTATSEHPKWQEIRQAVIMDGADETAVERLFDVSKDVAQKFEKVSERVSVAGGHVYLDGDEVPGLLSNQIARFLEEGVEDWKPLVAFMEKVSTNLNEHSRDQLFEWLARRNFTITPEGNFVAYKGVNEDLSSVHSGPGIVNGQPVNRVTNPIGGVIEIARSKVHHDPSVGCASGLHAGTWDYARGFGRVVLEVHVDPRDVVSVPTDCDWAKIRTCRYTVVRKVDAPITGASTGTVQAKVVTQDLDAPEYDSFSPDSSVIDYVEWDEDGVFVQLSNGNSYHHPDAPYSLFVEWKDAPSAGRFYNENVRGEYGEVPV